jgi:DNA-damage-inducible protein J
MSKMSQINIKVNSIDKEKAVSALKEMRLTLSSAIQIYLAKIAREGRIPFEISTDPFYSLENITELEKRIKNTKNRIDLVEHDLIEIE